MVSAVPPEGRALFKERGSKVKHLGLDWLLLAATSLAVRGSGREEGRVELWGREREILRTFGYADNLGDSRRVFDEALKTWRWDSRRDLARGSLSPQA